MLSPRALGTITRIAEKGSYAVDVNIAIFFRISVLFTLPLGYRFGDRIRWKNHEAYDDATLACTGPSSCRRKTNSQLPTANWSTHIRCTISVCFLAFTHQEYSLCSILVVYRVVQRPFLGPSVVARPLSRKLFQNSPTATSSFTSAAANAEMRSVYLLSPVLLIHLSLIIRDGGSPNGGMLRSLQDSISLFTTFNSSLN